MKTKTALAILLASASLASAVTITIDDDNATTFGFSVDWGSPIAPGNVTLVTSGGTHVEWQESPLGQHPELYGIQIGGTHFQGDIRIYLDFSNPTNPTFNNAIFGGSVPKFVFPLISTPYGAQFSYGVPDGGSTGLLLGLGAMGLCALRRSHIPMVP